MERLITIQVMLGLEDQKNIRPPLSCWKIMNDVAQVRRKEGKTEDKGNKYGNLERNRH